MGTLGGIFAGHLVGLWGFGDSSFYLAPPLARVWSGWVGCWVGCRFGCRVGYLAGSGVVSGHVGALTENCFLPDVLIQLLNEIDTNIKLRRAYKVRPYFTIVTDYSYNRA